MKRRGLSRLMDDCSPPPPLGGSERMSQSKSHRPRRVRGRLAAPLYVQPESRFDARHFDHSEPVTLSVTAFGAVPYRPFASREDYHLSAGRSAAYAQSHTHTHSQPFYVEPFDADDAGAAAPSADDAARYEDVEVGGRPGQNPRQARPASESDRAEWLAEQERRESEEFEADIRQILEGKKRYEASQRNGPGTTIEAPRTAPAAAPAPAPAKEEQPKDEHAIFEKIAQSMKLANAYDLGSVALNQRFDAFDRELEASRRRQAAAANPPVPATSPASTKPPAPENGPPPAQRTTEFLEDMDEIGQTRAKPGEARNGGTAGAEKNGNAAGDADNGDSAAASEGETTNSPSGPAAQTAQPDEGHDERTSS